MVESVRPVMLAAAIVPGGASLIRRWVVFLQGIIIIGGTNVAPAVLEVHMTVTVFPRFPLVIFSDLLLTFLGNNVASCVCTEVSLDSIHVVCPLLHSLQV